MNDRILEIYLALITALLALILIVLVVSRERRERSAYLQGRYNLDRATAWQLAGVK